MTSSKPNCFLKVPFPNAITLRVKDFNMNLEGRRDAIQSTITLFDKNGPSLFTSLEYAAASRVKKL